MITSTRRPAMLHLDTKNRFAPKGTGALHQVRRAETELVSDAGHSLLAPLSGTVSSKPVVIDTRMLNSITVRETLVATAKAYRLDLAMVQKALQYGRSQGEVSGDVVKIDGMEILAKGDELVLLKSPTSQRSHAGWTAGGGRAAFADRR